MAQRREVTPPQRGGEVCVVLVRPRYAENVGAAARALENAGAGALRLVAPNEMAREAIAQRVARGGEPRLQAARVFDCLEDAVAGIDLVVATSHKTGRRRRPLLPWELSGEIASALRPCSTALVFGPEDHGLSKEEVDLCHRLVTIPSHGPLNLAQSVIVLLYELKMRAATPPPSAVTSVALVGAPDVAAVVAADVAPVVAADVAPVVAADVAPSAAEGGDPREAPAPPGSVPRIVAAASAALARTGYPRHKKPLQLEMSRLADILSRAPLVAWEVNFLIGLFLHLDRWAAARSSEGDGADLAR